MISLRKTFVFVAFPSQACYLEATEVNEPPASRPQDATATRFHFICTCASLAASCALAFLVLLVFPVSLAAHDTDQ